MLPHRGVDAEWASSTSTRISRPIPVLLPRSRRPALVKLQPPWKAHFLDACGNKGLSLFVPSPPFLASCQPHTAQNNITLLFSHNDVARFSANLPQFSRTFPTNNAPLVESTLHFWLRRGVPNDKLFTYLRHAKPSQSTRVNYKVALLLLHKSHLVVMFIKSVAWRGVALHGGCTELNSRNKYVCNFFWQTHKPNQTTHFPSSE